MKDIAFNPLGFSTQDVQQQVTAGELSSAEVALVFGEELGQAILRAKGGEQLPEGGPCQGLTDSTQIVFWGIPHSGKTLAIASLLAEEGMQIEETGIPGIDQRIARLKQLFDQPAEFSSPSSAAGYTLLPDTHGHPRSENYHAVYKIDWWSAAYPLTFIEARLTGEPKSILIASEDGLALLCADRIRFYGLDGSYQLNDNTPIAIEIDMTVNQTVLNPRIGVSVYNLQTECALWLDSRSVLGTPLSFSKDTTIKIEITKDFALTEGNY